MNRNTSLGKPLFRYEQSMDYLRHKKKLIQIRNKSFHFTTEPSELSARIKQNMRNQMQSKCKVIESQNQKLLSKLIKISTRQSSTQAISGIKQKQNFYRKRWLKNIRKQNEELGQKLTNLKSSLQYSRFSKSIGDYQKIKRSMMLNRKAKLPLLPQLSTKQISFGTSQKFLKMFGKTTINTESLQRKIPQQKKNPQQEQKKLNKSNSDYPTVYNFL